MKNIWPTKVRQKRDERLKLATFWAQSTYFLRMQKQNSRQAESEEPSPVQPRDSINQGLRL